MAIEAVSIDRFLKSIRGRHVVLDADLASLYGVETRTLVQAVNRNRSRFPEDFMFRLSQVEFGALKSQTVISNPGRGGRRSRPYAFTEQGVAMLSSVLRSDRAIAINIEIMRAFVLIRANRSSNAKLARRLSELEQEVQRRFDSQDARIASALRAIRALMEPPPPSRRRIGFVPPDDH